VISITPIAMMTAPIFAAQFEVLFIEPGTLLTVRAAP
jgi:hypothetical protein